MNAAGRARRNATRSEKRQAALRRRRAMATAPERARLTTEVRRRRRRRVLGGIGVVVALGLIGLGVFLLWPEDGPDLSLRGKKIAANAPEQTLREPPKTYRITYADELATGSDFEQQTTVRRPFDVRYLLADPGRLTDPLYDSVVTKNVTSAKGSNLPTQERTGPAIAAFSARLDAMLPDLLANGFFERRERRSLLGEECTVYRTGAQLEGTVVTKPTKDVYTDWCVTDDSLVIDEISVRSGKPDLRATATKIERDPALSDADFPTSTDQAALDESGVKVFDLATDATPTSPYWRPSAVPAGWTLASRQRLEVTKADEGSTGPTPTRTSWADVYVKGADFVVIRQGATGEEPDQIDATNAIDATAGPLGAAKLVLGANGSTLVVTAKDGRFVQLSGTVASATLQSFAASLTLG